MNIDYDEMFASVQTSMAKEVAAKAARSGAALYNEKLKLTRGNEYVFRIVPYVLDGNENIKAKTFYRYYQYNWREAEGGKWRFVISPRTIGEKCPIAEWQNTYRRSASKEDVEKLRKMLGYREGHYMNVYVVDDPVNPENNGKIKILDCPKTVWNIVAAALDGELDEDWSEQRGEEVKVGPKVLDLSDNGVNLIVKVTEDSTRNGADGKPMVSYAKSKFSFKGAKLGLSRDEQEKILNDAYDLAKVDRVMEAEAISELFTKTFLPKLDGPVPEVSVPKSKKVVVDDEEETPAPKAAKKRVAVDDDEEAEDAVPKFKKTAPKQEVVDTEDEVDKFINELGLDEDDDEE